MSLKPWPWIMFIKRTLSTKFHSSSKLPKMERQRLTKEKPGLRNVREATHKNLFITMFFIHFLEFLDCPVEGQSCHSSTPNYDNFFDVQLAYTFNDCGGIHKYKYLQTFSLPTRSVLELCHYHESCTFWTLHNEKDCLLSDRCNPQENQTSIIGDKICPPGNFYKIFHRYHSVPFSPGLSICRCIMCCSGQI